jgi:uncharacterized protein (TIGR03435 family)
MRLKHAALVVIAAICFGQNKPAFEVASIKPNLSGPESGFSFDIAPSGRVTASNVDVWTLLRFAYSLRDSQISESPKWIKERRYDVQALPPQGSEAIPREQVVQMMRTLLEDRFRLKWHRESRPSRAYGLTIADHGPKLPPAREGRGRTRMGDLDAPSMSLESLCQILEFEFERPVLNRTGLSGTFAVRLQWASERAPKANQADDTSLPSLFTALQEQLGLKLESINAPVDIFVIDDVELPSEN